MPESYNDSVSFAANLLVAGSNKTCFNETCNNNHSGIIYYGWLYQHSMLKFSVEGVLTLCIGIFGVVGNVFTLLTLARQVMQCSAHSSHLLVRNEKTTLHKFVHDVFRS